MQMTRYIFVAFLPDELNKLINPIRERFEPGVSAIVPPHISLTFPFWFKKATDINVQLEKFQAKISGLGTFEKGVGKKVLYLKVEPQEKFKSINNQLVNSLINNIVYDNSIFPNNVIPEYVPHITLAMDTTEKISADNLIGCQFPVDRIFLLKKEENEKMWGIERMYYA